MGVQIVVDSEKMKEALLNLHTIFPKGIMIPASWSAEIRKSFLQKKANADLFSSHLEDFQVWLSFDYENLQKLDDRIIGLDYSKPKRSKGSKG